MRKKVHPWRIRFFCPEASARSGQREARYWAAQILKRRRNGRWTEFVTYSIGVEGPLSIGEWAKRLRKEWDRALEYGN